MINQHGGLNSSRFAIGFEQGCKPHQQIFKPHHSCDHDQEESIIGKVMVGANPKIIRYKRRQFKHMRINCLIDYKQPNLFLVSSEPIPGQDCNFDLVERVTRPIKAG
jgi:hypothetical protein